MRNFRKLDIWVEARRLVKEIYLITNKLPETEKFGLKSQLNRAAVSVPSNIAEGSAKDSQKDFMRFLQISLGSSFEVETQLILCADLEFIPLAEISPLIEEIQNLQKKIASLIKYIKTII